jgi:two-component system alkaline phosphatase synthesis response regulator PhoP
MPRILVIEDEPAMREGLRYNLDFEGHEVVLAADGYAGLDEAKKGEADLILLDLMLPGLGGLGLLKRLRQDGLRTPVVILTAKGQEADKVAGLGLGADDYVTKPFSVRELLARIDAVLRRARGQIESPVPARFTFGDVVVDFERRLVTRGGEPVALSFKEFEIVRFLVRRRGQIVSRDELLDQVWGYAEDAIPNTRTVDTHIAKLRKKLEGHATRGSYIQTVHKVGYRFQADAPAESGGA